MRDQPDAGPVRNGPRIRISGHGPYLVSGGPQLTARKPALDKDGNAVAWTRRPGRQSGCHARAVSLRALGQQAVVRRDPSEGRL